MIDHTTILTFVPPEHHAAFHEWWALCAETSEPESRFLRRWRWTQGMEASTPRWWDVLPELDAKQWANLVNWTRGQVENWHATAEYRRQLAEYERLKAAGLQPPSPGSSDFGAFCAEHGSPAAG